MSEKSDAINKVAEEIKNDFDNWLNDLETKEQPKACNIDSSDCETCGS